jgi:hypothetical protein
MKTRLAFAAAALFTFAGAANATTQPSVGTYNVVAYKLSQTGAGCTPGAVGSTSVGTLSYPGAAGTGATLYNVKNDSAKFGFSVATFPKTPAAGVKSWSGAIKIVEQPQGTSKNGTFTGTFTFIDSGHFLLLLKPTQSGCTQTIQITAYSQSGGVVPVIRGQ